MLRGPGPRALPSNLFTALAVLAVCAACGDEQEIGAQEDIELEPALAQLVQQYAREAEANAGDPEAHATLGYVYETNSLWARALDCFDEAARLDPDEPTWAYHAIVVLERATESDEAFGRMEEHAARFTAFAPLQHRYGGALLERNRPEEAEHAFQRARESAPSAPEPLTGLGAVALLGGDAQRAVQLLGQALSIDPDFATARYLYGRALAALGRTEEAEAHLRAGAGAPKRSMLDAWAARQPSFVVGLDPMFQKATELLDAGRLEEAIQIFERTDELHPNEFNVLVNLGIAYVHVKRYDDAAAVLRRALTLDDGRFEVHLNLAACLHQMGRLDDALASVDRAIAIAPRVAMAQLNRAALLLQLGRYEEAHTSLAETARLDPQNPIVQQQLGSVCMRLRRHAEALEHYRVLVTLTPSAWHAHARLCEAALATGAWDEARAALAAARALAPAEPSLDTLAREVAQRAPR